MNNRIQQGYAPLPGSSKPESAKPVTSVFDQIQRILTAAGVKITGTSKDCGNEALAHSSQALASFDGFFRSCRLSVVLRPKVVSPTGYHQTGNLEEQGFARVYIDSPESLQAWLLLR